MLDKVKEAKDKYIDTRTVVSVIAAGLLVSAVVWGAKKIGAKQVAAVAAAAK